MHRLEQHNSVILYFADKAIQDGTVLSHSDTGVELRLVANNRQYQVGEQLCLTLQDAGQSKTRKAQIKTVKGASETPHLDIDYLDHIGLEPATHKLDVDKIKIDPGCTLKIPAAVALRRKILPFLQDEKVLHVVSAQALKPGAARPIERMLKSPICLWQANDAAKLDDVLRQVYGNAATKPSQPSLVAAQPAENIGTAIDLGDDLLYAAFIRDASDIHIDPSYKNARIRFRVDGQLELYEHIKSDMYTELSSRIKVMANLDIAEKRAPQDGRFTHSFAGGSRRIDIRVATLPTKYGERITMRLLALKTGSLTLNNLGFSTLHEQQIVSFLRRTQGMMILTGPTGSGKTTTLYAAIRMLLAERNVNVITVEDPIEYEIDGVAQCEVDHTSGKVDFAKALRSILRHDPDVVMIGEIRDSETANIAIKAALTGHVVFGTLHTNSAAASITRLIDMGVEPYLVAAALRMAVAQRLLRRLCHFCRVKRSMTKAEARTLNQIDLCGSDIYDATGCVYCGNRGYSGRVGLYETLELHEQWARAVAEGGTEGELVSEMRQSGVKSLLQDAIDKLIAGDTSFQEVIQIASSW